MATSILFVQTFNSGSEIMKFNLDWWFIICLCEVYNVFLCMHFVYFSQFPVCRSIDECEAATLLIVTLICCIVDSLFSVLPWFD